MRAMFQMRVGVAVKLIDQFANSGLDGQICFGIIWRQQPIVQAHSAFIGLEPKLRIRLQPRTSLQTGAKGLLQPIKKLSGRRLLARVHQTESALIAVRRKIGFVSNQNRPRPAADVLIVGHVDQKMLGDRLLLNPTMESGHELLAANAGGIFDEKFDDDLVSFHRGVH